MKTFIKIVTFILLLIINYNCSDEHADYVRNFLGNYTFEIISSEGKQGKLKTVDKSDTTYYNGIIRNYKKEDADDYYKGSGIKEGSQNNITIQYQKDKIIVFHVSVTGIFAPGYDNTGSFRWGEFTSSDTVEFHNSQSLGERWSEIRVIGLRK